MTRTPKSPARARSRNKICLDRDWRFSFGHPHDRHQDHQHGIGHFSYIAKAGYGDGAAAPEFDDRAWRKLNLPHDWAVELPFAKEAGHSHGYKALGRNFPEHSIGWYRKRFTVAASELGRRFELSFDGVFRAARVFVNGYYLDTEPSGHSSFHFDISDYLEYGGQNVIAVRVDASFEEGWYYEGAGIYRHVWLTETHPLRIAHDGIFVTSELSNAHAALTVRAEVENSTAEPVSYAIVHRVFDEANAPIAERREAGLTVAPTALATHAARLVVPEPHLWCLEAPHLYRLETTIFVDDAPVDQVETRFGIRSAVFDPERGFFLNGRRVQLKGTNNHQDHAGLGTALPDAMQDYRLERLKSFGCNAYRCAHHPPTPELLDACDRLGMLVIDETRSMGSTTRQLGELERLIRRDRNHPSVILWSLGNEEWAIEGSTRGARIAATMQRRAQQLDRTRPCTVGICSNWGKGISSVVDVMGYNYIAHGSTDEQHARYPRQPGVGTEETTTQCTRGVYETNPKLAHSAPVMVGTSGGNCEVGWKHYAERPYLAGLFYWTGFDYRGEPDPFEFPAVLSQFGILDVCGFEKDWTYYLKAWWGSERVLHLMPHWNWKGREGERISVCVFSNAEQVELKLNGKSLGTKAVERNGHLEWSVPYAPGRLEALGRKGSDWTLVRCVETTGAATALQLEVDRARISAEGGDVAVVKVSALDAAGRAVPTANPLVHFKLEGAGSIIGVGNGDPSSHEREVYFDAVECIELAALSMRVIEGTEVLTEFDDASDDQDWLALGAVPPEVSIAKSRIFRGTLKLNAPLDVERARLLLRWFGESQEVYLNGKQVAKLSRQVHRELPEVQLTREELITGKNTLTVLATPYRDDECRQRDERIRPGVLRIDRPACPWQRSLFNGLAQVIVQSNGNAGEIVLDASAPGLARARVSVVAHP